VLLFADVVGGRDANDLAGDLVDEIDVAVGEVAGNLLVGEAKAPLLVGGRLADDIAQFEPFVRPPLP